MSNYVLKAQLASGQVIDLTNLVITLSWSELPDEIAQRATIQIANTKIALGYMSDLLQLFTMIYVFVDGRMVFQGIVWQWEYKSALQKQISIVAYSRLIMATKSKDSSYYSAGNSTQDIISDICHRWEIPMVYQYRSHIHPIVKYSNLSISEQIYQTLDEAWRKLGVRYVMFLEENTLYIQEYGMNEDVYVFHANNVKFTENKLSLDQFVTKVVILGKEPKEGRAPILETMYGAVEFGTIQEVITNADNTTIDDARREAENILKERGHPQETILVSAPDVPVLRKGHKIKLVAGNLSGYFYVEGITHNGVAQEMDMQLIRQSS